MATRNFLAQSVITMAGAQSYLIQQDDPMIDDIQVSVWPNHLAYTGGYGNALIQLSSTQDVLKALGKQSFNGYILSKVKITDMTKHESRSERESLMCDVIRYLAENR